MKPAEIAKSLLEQLSAMGVEGGDLVKDSRNVKRGDIFVAYPGPQGDGRQWITDAVTRGAAAVLHEMSEDPLPSSVSVPSIAVRGLRDLSGFLADEFYGHPSSKLWMAGVTGTNGKTTVSQWLAQCLFQKGIPTGLIGTLGTGMLGQPLQPSLNTTPDAIELHKSLDGFCRVGAKAAVMEVSSIGIEQGRIYGAHFNVAIFTNLSRDHLDYHGSMAEYGAVKARFFDAPGLDCAVVNLDDAFGLKLASDLSTRGLNVIGTSIVPILPPFSKKIKVLHAQTVQAQADGLEAALVWEGEKAVIHTQLLGRFNLSNLLQVIACCLAKGLGFRETLDRAAALKPPAGRMEVLGGGDQPLVVVDYAHTPDALEKALDALEETALARGGRLVCVFGCGGDRDVGKRPMMGQVASSRAAVWVTSDNPRRESPQAIIDQILKGITGEVHVVVDRFAAISEAIAASSENDVILIAGKGHEPYQEVAGERFPFSDIETARFALEKWSGGCQCN